MSKEQIFSICDSLIDELTVLKGFTQLNRMNNKIDHSMGISQAVENIERMINKLVKEMESY